jgi:HSP20 family protein
MTGMLARHRDISSMLDEFFNDEFWGLTRPPNAGSFLPALDVLSTPKAYVVRIDLPGMTKEDVNIRVEDGYMTIEGVRGAVKEKTETQFHRTERVHGKFCRMFKMPTDIDTSNISAKMENGVLEVSVAKPEERKPNTFSVKIT